MDSSWSTLGLMPELVLLGLRGFRLRSDLLDFEADC